MKLAVMPIAASLALVVAAVISPVGPAGLQVTATSDPSTATVAATLDRSWGDTAKVGATAATSVASWDPQTDLGSMYSVAASTGAQAVWQTTDLAGNAVTGAGVTVAVIDTGISPVAGLNGPGKIIDGPDLSSEGSSKSTRYIDTVGHGTHMAGIIAASDLDAAGDTADVTTFVGVAPGARLLNMKVGSDDAGVEVGQVIAAIDWVVKHRNDDGMNVRVLNISSGTAAYGDYLGDPLAAAVESAWNAGIVVVAAAGNDGGNTALTMPAADPFVIAVGSSDNQGTVTLADDIVSPFTNEGTPSRRPDLLAPGKSVVSLRVPGSTADLEHPEGLVAGDGTGRFFKGTGTSQSAAVVSGTVALLLQARPNLTPDQVKALLTSSSVPMAVSLDAAAGAGQVNIARALQLDTPTVAAATQAFAPSKGLDSALTNGHPAAGAHSEASGTWEAWHWGAWHWGAWHWGAWHWGAWHWGAWHWGAWHWGAWHWGAWHWGASSWT